MEYRQKNPLKYYALPFLFETDSEHIPAACCELEMPIFNPSRVSFDHRGEFIALNKFFSLQRKLFFV
jgi:hypothetical protein